MTNKKQILILDCDGVILDSKDEGLVTAANVLQKTTQGNRILTVDDVCLYYFNADRTLAKYRPFLRSGSDYLYICGVLVRETKIYNSTDAFERDAAKFLTEESCDASTFYDMRKSLVEEHSDAVNALIHPYLGMPEVFTAARNRYSLYVSSSKPEAHAHLTRNNIKIDEDRVYTKEKHGEKKSHHLQLIADRENVSKSAIIVVDDNLGEIQDVTTYDAAINVVFATWGYNTKAQQREAATLGARCLSLKQFYQAINNGEL